MIKSIAALLVIAAALYALGMDDAQTQVVKAQSARCAAFAANGLDC